MPRLDAFAAHRGQARDRRRIRHLPAEHFCARRDGAIDEETLLAVVHAERARPAARSTTCIPSQAGARYGRACSLDRSAAISAWTVSRSVTPKPFAKWGLTARSLSASTPV